MSLPTTPQTWTRGPFLISTDSQLLSLASINDAFDQDFMYWTKPYPEEILQTIINNSFCFGLYEVNESKPRQQIGFARLITDRTTFAYLSDLYVLPKYWGLGLGGWVIDCVDEVLVDLPHLRWTMLRTGTERSKQAYEKRMGMTVLGMKDISEGPIMMGRRGKGVGA
ncbi:hypothetical protein BO70DRAFT_129880 [Aspergillus heteromorphus CBS 117.55]|uniref:N-acetyltransferase domain-containing protein n=1 Tax=Aspergillus heteromorphus CBS 117.55 TaxID=1448321 RepID=A0A317WTV0_9EURO|nr:uncharacterized protein BO70DRAFT_129880 [Aspergillus heteromorphus CBS 117.55]PWY89843.1 hypothetical protein BO70DRAFT_129880 [Aspergillus heteromorphus CBS 117.55]